MNFKRKSCRKGFPCGSYFDFGFRKVRRALRQDR